MTHFELELSEHGTILLWSITLIAAWLFVLNIIALIVVADRYVDRAIKRAVDEDDDADRGEQEDAEMSDPNE